LDQMMESSNTIITIIIIKGFYILYYSGIIPGPSLNNLVSFCLAEL